MFDCRQIIIVMNFIGLSFVAGITMATSDEFNCCICLDVAEEAVETDCCGQLFCDKCLAPLREKPCPQCRAKPLIVRPNKFARRAIANFTVPCPNGCSEIISQTAMTSHMESCEKKIYSCRGPKCEFTGNRKQYFDHLTSEHVRHLAKNGHQIFAEIDGNELGEDWRQKSIEQKSSFMNGAGYIARYGKTGKYYCGQKDRSNFTCGPSTGNNCVPCMKLDLEARGLSKGWLVNKSGAPTQLSSRGKFHCGRRIGRIGGIDPYCHPRHGGQCEDCAITDTSKLSYAELL